MTNHFIHSGVCSSKNDIKILKSGTWIINKSDDNNCQNLEKKHPEQATNTEKCKINIENKICGVEGCKGWCDANAITAMTWCSKVFKAPQCQAGCALAVYAIQKGCHWCCDGQGFYKRCIEPFGYIVDYMEEPCDPYWD
ncbi:hypothetical protein [Candidatus Protochlamydia sp. R18]|uniref:hypothetical protein n=1 Tax=Candidatus Protochlamydia sp. R18 TaxID=1353977 RepID=UPI0005A84999|nr:hypothetical protein [Candidatus Protochlamydia sp. R18]